MTAGKDSRQQSSPVIEKQFISLIHAAIDAILGIDYQGRITIWNKAATKMFGHSSSHAIGMNLHDLIRLPASGPLASGWHCPGYQREQTGKGSVGGK